MERHLSRKGALFYLSAFESGSEKIVAHSSPGPLFSWATELHGCGLEILVLYLAIVAIGSGLKIQETRGKVTVILKGFI